MSNGLFFLVEIAKLSQDKDVTCSISDQQLWSWIDREDSRLSEHLQRCSQCRSRADELRAAVSVLEPESLTQMLAPKAIKNYEIIRALGQGAMAVVYEARQIDTGHRVAIKVFKNQYWDPSEVERLYAREVQILARFQHPNIAQFYEAGRTRDGNPYLVMELVPGESITRFIARRKLDSRSILQLFVRICRAVQHAHQRGVIHRDLKPENIMVIDSENQASLGESPWIKVLDFGLAKVTKPDPSLALITQEIGQVVGTLPYMAPEQVQGLTEDLDIRVDVYSLGVLLFESLTQRYPYSVLGKSPKDATRVIIEEVPTRPRAIQPTLPADLERIILKAIQKDKNDRYASVAALGDDLMNFMDHRPVNARPATSMYLLKTLTRRHRAISVLSISFLTLLSFFIAHTGYQSMQLRHQSMRTEVADGAVTDYENLLGSMLASLDPFSDPIKIENVLNVVAQSLAKGFEHDPFVRFDFHLLLSLPYYHNGNFEKAVRQAEIALAGFRESEASPQRIARAQFLLGKFLFELGDFRNAERLLLKTLQQQRTFSKILSESIAATLYVLGKLYHQLGQYRSSEKMLAEALEIEESLFGTYHENIARIYSALSKLALDQGKRKESMAYLQQSVRIQSELNLHFTPDVVENYALRSMLFKTDKRMLYAETELREALEEQSNVLGWDHPQLANTLIPLGTTLLQRDQPQEAEIYLKRAHELRKKTYPKNSVGLAETLSCLARLSRTKGRLNEAEEQLEAAHRLLVLNYGSEHPKLALSWLERSKLAARNGNLKLAMEHIAMAEAIHEQNAEIRPHDFARILEWSGRLAGNLGQFPLAESKVSRCFRIRKEVYGPRHTETVRAQQRLADIKYQAMDWVGAERFYRNIIEMRRNQFNENTRLNAEAMLGLAKILLQKQEETAFRETRELLFNAKNIFELPKHQDHPLRQEVDELLVVTSSRHERKWNQRGLQDE